MATDFTTTFQWERANRTSYTPNNTSMETPSTSKVINTEASSNAFMLQQLMSITDLLHSMQNDLTYVKAQIRSLQDPTLHDVQQVSTVQPEPEPQTVEPETDDDESKFKELV